MFSLTLNNKEIFFAKPAVMGILNITPDSFYEESKIKTIDDALHTTEQMLKNGASFIDIGGQTTKPNALQINEDEELKRVLPIVAAIHKKFPEAHISVDTFYSKVAKETVAAGASLINDISAGSIDTAMFETISKLQVPYICMHIKGTPKTMQQHTNYYSVTNEVYDYFVDKIALLEQLNVKDIIIDIGFGFAKTTEQNFELIKNLNFFKTHYKPILVGVSRKSSIYKTLNITPQQALNGTTVLNTIALVNGAAILRVHDVKEAVECVSLYEYCK